MTLKSAGDVCNKPIIAVVGCTGTGKTQLSLDLARALGGEIINSDAMQVRMRQEKIYLIRWCPDLRLSLDV